MVDLVQTFKDGGPVMWPLLATAMTGLAISFERTIVLHQLPTAKQCEKQLSEMEDILVNQGLEGAAKKVSKGKGILNYVFARLLKRYDTLLAERRDLENRRIQMGDKKLEGIDPVTKYLQESAEITELRDELFVTIDDAVKSYVGKFLPALDTVGAIATLMGLLGTITGMIQAFGSIATSGTGDPRIVAGGIAQALITTAAGLFIAIPAVCLYRYLSFKADQARGGIELYSVSFANTLIAMMKKVK